MLQYRRMASKNPSKTLVIVDGNALVHRAFHALPPTLTSPSGQMTNAVYGFATIFLKMYRELKPDYVAVTFDRAAKTFRHDTYTEYKATRVKQPDELYEQFPLIKELVATFNVPIYELDGYEADDVIGTICKTTDGGVKKIIVTGDMDALQLIDDHTAVYTLKKGIGETVIYDAAAVEEKYGLTPKQIIDYKALRGDASDNIPGVRGIGEKTATELLQTFGTLDAVLKAAKKKDPKIKERIRLLLTEYEADARLSEELATIVTDAPIDFELDDARVQPINRQAVFKLFQELGFKSLLNRLPDNSPAVPTKTQGSLLGAAPDQATPTDDETSVVALRDGYHLITTAAAATKLAEEIAHQDTIALDTETTGLDPLSDRLLGLGLGWANGVAYYVTAPAISAELKKILADPKIKKVGHNLKFDIKVLATAGLAVNGVWFDTMVAAYLLNPGSRAHDLDTMAFTELGYEMTPIESLIGPKGKGQVTLADVALDRVADYCCEDVDYTWRLYAKLADELERQNMLGLMEKIETPLIPVLATMELTGVNIDGDFLDELDGDLENRRQKIDQQIYKLADKKFNIDSPLQLKEVLFDDLKISTAGLKKVKTGISTAAAELEKLAGRHPIIELISEHRELAKLQSTYTQALPKLVHPRTGRVHTSFNQTVTATGRLSSSDPNLQNIPIRTELGREIRKAFVADKGNVIVAADYSQIELRIVASLASDQHMIEIFRAGKDIHAATAAKIFDVPLDQVTKDMRRKAKEVNFGVLYGMGAYGLSWRTGISLGEAQEFIEKYFEAFDGVRDWIEGTLRHVREEGFVETLLGRIRYLPEIHSGMAPVRKAAERMAINAPIQGTAADLMKLAMIAVQAEIAKRYPAGEVKMVLQVHDELVFEVKKSLLAEVSTWVKDIMENIYELRVPIEVKVETGRSWGETTEI